MPAAPASKKIAHYYRYARKHQLDTYGNSGLHVGGVDQRQFTGGGAYYGMHAVAAYQFARQHTHFLADLGRTLAARKAEA